MANQRKKRRKGPAKETVIQAVRCPFCSAACGELCWDDEGVQMIRGVHRSRRAAYGRMASIRAGKPLPKARSRTRSGRVSAKRKPMTLAESMAAMRERNATREQGISR